MSKKLLLEQVSVEELVVLIAERIKEQLSSLHHPNVKPQKELPELITREKLAEILSVSLPTIHNWIKAGILTPYKMGNRTYFKRSEVLEYIYSTNTKKVA